MRSSNPTKQAGAAAPSRPSAFLLPLAGFIGICVILAIGLTRNPREVPSPLIGKPVPEFELPPVQGRQLGLGSRDLRGEISLVNVFASWCAACRDEHPLLLDLMARGDLPIHGLNYKDKPEDAAKWLDALGDPYTRTGVDRDGRVAIDWGVYGVPETFVIDREGRILYKHIGTLTSRVLREKLLPIIERAKKGPSG